MKISIFIILICFLSCSSANNTVKINRIETTTLSGVITATEYKIPLPCEIKVFHKKKKIISTTSDNEGIFELGIESKFINKPLIAYITPMKNYVKKDTLFNEYFMVMADCMFHNPDKKFLTDTIYFSPKDSSYIFNWSIKGCQGNPFGVIEEH